MAVVDMAGHGAGRRSAFLSHAQGFLPAL